MLRARLPLLFAALAVAAPFLWLWYFRWSVRNETHMTDPDGTAAGLTFLAWIITSVIFVVLFVALAALTWKPASEGLRNLRRVILFFFGGTTLLAGVGIFLAYAFNAQDPGWRLTGIGVSVLFIGSGILAGREFFLGLSGDDPAEGAIESKTAH